MSELILIGVMYLFPCNQIASELEQAHVMYLEDVYDAETAQMIEEVCGFGVKI